MPDDDDLEGFGTVSGYGRDADPEAEAAESGVAHSPGAEPPSPPMSDRSSWFDWFRRLLRK
jgi:hypothetical protein